jgi:hypothetical protein
MSVEEELLIALFLGLLVPIIVEYVIRRRS